MNDLIRLYIEEIVRLHSVPISIVSDKDPRFTAQFWRSIQRALGAALDFREHWELSEFGNV